MPFKLKVTSGTQGFAIMEIEMSKIAKVGILDVSLKGLIPLEVALLGGCGDLKCRVCSGRYSGLWRCPLEMG